MSATTAAPAALRSRDVYRAIGGAYASRAGLLLIAALLVFVPVDLLEALERSVEDLDPDELGDLEALALVGGVLLHALGALAGEVFFTGLVAALVAELRGSGRHPFLHVLRRLPYGRLIAIDLVFSLVVAIGIVALIVPGLVLSTWYALAPVVAKLEDRGVRASFRRSRELVRGRFWTALWVVVPVSVAGDALATAAQDAGASTVGGRFAGDWLGAVLGDLVFSPLYALAIVLLTYELRDREPGGLGAFPASET